MLPVSATSQQLEQWRSNSLAWARREFVYEHGLQSFRAIME